VSTHYFRFNWRNAIARQRCRRLETLLARSDDCSAVTDWRADAFWVIAAPGTAMPGLGAAALFADHGAVEGAAVLIATPVRYVAEMSNVRLAADGILSLRPAEAEALAGDFNRVWYDAGIRLLAGRGAALFCVSDQPLQAATDDPEEILDRHIDEHRPTGAGAPRLRQLMSEIEMWLFEHAVNQARIAAGVPAVSGLWLWGCGPALGSLPPIAGWAAGQDPFVSAFAAPPNVSRGADSGVVVSAAEPGTAEWGDLESGWLDRSLEELRRGRIARLQLSAGHRQFSVGARWSRRFWRRPRPWWEYFA
jgi:hypothetical protein